MQLALLRDGVLRAPRHAARGGDAPRREAGGDAARAAVRLQGRGPGKYGLSYS